MLLYEFPWKKVESASMRWQRKETFIFKSQDSVYRVFFGWFKRHTYFLFIDFFTCSFCDHSPHSPYRTRSEKSKWKTYTNKAHDLYCHFHLFTVCCCIYFFSHSCSFTIPSHPFHPQAYFHSLDFWRSFFSFFFLSVCLIFALLFVYLFVCLLSLVIVFPCRSFGANNMADLLERRK